MGGDRHRGLEGSDLEDGAAAGRGAFPRQQWPPTPVERKLRQVSGTSVRFGARCVQAAEKDADAEQAGAKTVNEVLVATKQLPSSKNEERHEGTLFCEPKLAEGTQILNCPSLHCSEVNGQICALLSSCFMVLFD